MRSVRELNKLANKFEEKLNKIAQTTSAQSGDFQGALERAKLWDYNSISNTLNPFLDKIGYQSKFDTDIIVDKNGGVKIVVKGNDPKNPQVQSFLQQNIAPKMSSIFKNNKLAVTDTIVVPWLSQAG